MRGTGRFNLAQGLTALSVGIGAGLSNLTGGYVVQWFGYPAGFLTLAGRGRLRAGGVRHLHAGNPCRRGRPGVTGTLLASPWLSWAIAALATAGVIVRPFGWPECVWAVPGAALLVLLGLLPSPGAGRGVAKGTDVYLFLTGMMLLSELARQEGLFDWLAAHGRRRRAARPPGCSRWSSPWARSSPSSCPTTRPPWC